MKKYYVFFQEIMNGMKKRELYGVGGRMTKKLRTLDLQAFGALINQCSRRELNPHGRKST